MKKILCLVFSLVIIVGLTGCGNQTDTSKSTSVDNNTNTNTTTNTTTNTQTSDSIDMNKAKDIALADAGFSEQEVTDLSTEKDNDENKYDISFKNGGKEYDYDISLTGDIIQKNVENDD